MDVIPLVDLRPQLSQVKQEVMTAIGTVIEGQNFINGPEVATFETAMADYLGAEFAIGVSSGTDALLMTLMALEIGPQDEVITTPFSFVASAEIIRRVGARPVFADVEHETALIRPAAVSQHLSSHTKAIIPVHLYGQMCAIEELTSLSKERDVPILEDCAQSLGARLNRKAAGTFGIAGAFSFFPTKNLGGWGDAGMLVTNDGQLAKRLRQIRNHGASGRDKYEHLGGNFRLDTIQAAVLSVKLRYLDEWLLARKKAAAYYNQLLVQAGLSAGPNETRHPGHRIIPPLVSEDAQHTYNLYVVRAERRDELKKHLAQVGVTSQVYYPTPIHLQACFADLGYREGDLPVAEEIARTTLALPFYAEISRPVQQRVVESISEFYHRS
ncbi:MAG: DegT/DnrJ/EryC1/StrS family aminotransferase [Deltaproteobacteria bacterium]|nr:DegT/DnrJ/EryC1/StrS family aminotransferase [Deltaproteobacteria bacterium]MBW1873157.1 DegT/DnrJ/EryC1/StrS family aminotransferase [Deltaproteobacteria bacterium]